MRYNIKAIETEYKGHLFRSRLEARWAAFFDLCGWKWTYEPADFNGWFPDFALHGVQDIFVEVKPDTTFPQDVADKIDASGCEQECLILGSACPLPSSDRRGDCRIGWLKQVDEDGFKAWAEAGFGAAGKRDFCSADHSFDGRMTGEYDGSYSFAYDDLQSLWGAAQRQTRYEHPSTKQQATKSYADSQAKWKVGSTVSYADGITLTATDNQSWRMERLRKAVAYLRSGLI